MSYGRLFRQIEETTAALRALGIGRGDRVAVVLPNGPEMAACFVAVAAAAACAPLNPAYRPSEFEFYLSDLKPKALVVLSGQGSEASAVAGKLGIPVIDLSPRLDDEAGAFSLSTASPAPSGGPHDFGESDDLALILHTSGTTSRPKMVALTQSNLCHSARQTSRVLKLTAADRCLNVMPLFHIHGLIGAVLSSFSAGACVVCTPGFSAPDFFGWVEDFAPTWYTAVPTMHQAVLARAPQSGETIARRPLRFIRSCSAALPPHVMAELEKAFGVPVVEAYGMTEASHQMACNPLPPLMRKPGSVGVATGETQIAIMGENAQLLPAGQVGEVVIRGASVTAGYLENPEANRSSFVDGWFRTGDQGQLDEGGYLRITGRIKEIINRGGEKISPREIDEVAMEYPAVAQAVAFALPDPRLGEDVGLAVVLKAGVSVTERELREFIAERLAEFKVPRRVVFVQEIPKGPTGKLQRIGLAEKLSLTEVAASPESTPAAPTFAPPTTPMENLLAAMWQQVLRIERVGINDNFFDIGGDSASAAQLAASIEQVTGAKLSIGALLEAPTIAQLAAAISDGRTTTHDPRVVAVQSTGSRPPFFCVNAGPMYRNLASRLGPDQPLLSLYCPDTSVLPTPYRLEDLAAYHVETLRSVQPKGPYLLGGWCTSGLLAYEIAQQLLAQGEDVALLALFDAVNPAYRKPPAAVPNGGSKDTATRASFGGKWLREAQMHLAALRGRTGREVLDYTLQRLDSVLFRLKRKALLLSYDAHIRLGLPVAGSSLRDEETIRHFMERDYRPLPYPGRVVLFRRSLRPSEGPEDSQFGWKDIVLGGLEAHDIPGGHRDMFAEPHVQVTAAKLSACLSTVRRKSPAAASEERVIAA